MYLYLAGAITVHYLNNELEKATEWRNYIINNFCEDNCIEYFNPVKTFLKERNQNSYKLNDKIVVDQNRYFLNKSDIVIVNMNTILDSPGTIWEIIIATEMKKPIIAFGNKTWSPHINNNITYFCKDVDEVIDMLTDMFDQNNF